jgi:hypothetical protein
MVSWQVDKNTIIARPRIADQPRAHLVPAAHGAAARHARVVGRAEDDLVARARGDAPRDRRENRLDCTLQ